MITKPALALLKSNKPGHGVPKMSKDNDILGKLKVKSLTKKYESSDK